MTAAFGGGRDRKPQTAMQTWRGVVTRLADGRPYVEIPRLAPGYEYGPMETVQVPTVAPLAPLAVGDRVLVTFLEGRADDPVVIGRLA